MGFEFQDRGSDTLYNGKDLELVLDDERDIGEVYLDGDLIFQADGITDVAQLKFEFKNQFEVITSEPESDASDHIEEDDPEAFDDDEDYDDTDLDDPGLQEEMWTAGGEYATEDMVEYKGDYHIHPKNGPMQGKFHSNKKHGRLIPLSFEEVADIRSEGFDVKIGLDYDIREDYDEYGD